MDKFFAVDYTNPETGNKPNYKFEYGEVYIFFLNKLGAQENIFTGTAGSICFINSFFKGAIKVPIYFERNKRELLKEKNIINGSNMFPFKLEEHGFFDKILIVSLAKLKKVDIAVIETTGLTNASIAKLIKCSFLFLKQNPEKLVVLVDNNYSDMLINIIVKIDKENIDKDLDEWLPTTLIHNKIPIDFKLKSK